MSLRPGCIRKLLNRKKINGRLLELIANHMLKFSLRPPFLQNKVNIENLLKKNLWGKNLDEMGKTFFILKFNNYKLICCGNRVGICLLQYFLNQKWQHLSSFSVAVFNVCQLYLQWVEFISKHAINPFTWT